MSKAERIVQSLRRSPRLYVFSSCLILFLSFATASLFAQSTPGLPEDGIDPEISETLNPADGIQEEDLLKPPPKRPGTSLHTIVLDPGHGGRDTGVRGQSGLLEKNVVLSVAKKLSTLIRSRMGSRVILTRTGDYSLPLPERTAIGNNAKGQIFISLHSEGDFRRETEGHRVFILGPFPPPKPAVPGADENSRRQAVLWDVAQKRNLDRSGRFARSVINALATETGVKGTSLREARLLVLHGAQMPAILVSIGHLTNPRDESFLAKDDFLDKVAQGLFTAIRDHIQGEDVSN